MAWDTLFAGVSTEASTVITDVLPIAVGVFALLAAIGIAVGVFRKLGVRR